MDREWIEKQRRELQQLLEDGRLHAGVIKCQPDQHASSMKKPSAFMEFVNRASSRDEFQTETEKLREENKELKRQLALKTLTYK